MNRAVQASYEPGSTFKIVTAAAARERNRVGYSELFDCSAGFIKVGGTVITDHERFGVLSFPQVLIHSSNVGTVQFAQRLSIPEYYEMIQAFGFGTRTGIDLPREDLGPVSSADKWNKNISLPHVAIGYEVMVTPLQTLRAMNVFATGGLYVRPHVVKDGGTPGDGPTVEDGDGPVRVISEKIAKELVEPRLQGRRRGRHGQGRPARRLRRRRQDRHGPEIRPRPQGLHDEIHGLVRRVHAARRAAPVHDHRPRRTQGSATTAARSARRFSRTSPGRSCAISASPRNALCRRKS